MERNPDRDRTDALAARTGPAIPDPTRPRRKNTLRRADLAPGDCLCNHCSGKCCKYFSLPIDTPEDWSDFDLIRRYLTHGKTLVYVEKGTWYLVVMTRCKYLATDNRCKIYFNRPKICQDYTTVDCEYDEDWIFEKVFETPEQLEEYAEAFLPPRRRSRPVEFDTHRTFSLPIETPTGWDDYDAIRWYLAHGSTVIYLRKQTWYLLVKGGQESLADDTSFEKVFETPEQLWEYAEAVLPPRKRPKVVEPMVTLISPLPNP